MTPAIITTVRRVARIGSLFSGVGGLELGLERAIHGAVTSWQVEIDPFCRRVLERRWPHARRFDDIHTVGAHNLDPVDVVCGGFPCQDISVAGRGAGLDGERSGLFFEYARIVREIRPRVIVMENVTALLARGLDRVLGELASCGYDAEWDCIPASAVGAPHQRDRIWIVAHAVSDRSGIQPERGELGQAERQDADTLHAGEAWPVADADMQRVDVPAGPQRQRVSESSRPCIDVEIANTAGQGWGFQGRIRPGSASSEGTRSQLAGRDPGWVVEAREWGQPPSPVRRVDDGLSARMDRPRRRRPVNDKHRLHALGNAVVPLVAEVIGRRVNQIIRGNGDEHT